MSILLILSKLAATTVLADVNTVALPIKSKGTDDGYQLTPARLNLLCIPEYCIGYCFTTVFIFWEVTDGDLPKNTRKTRLSVEPGRKQPEQPSRAGSSVLSHCLLLYMLKTNELFSDLSYSKPEEYTQKTKSSRGLEILLSLF